MPVKHITMFGIDDDVPQEKVDELKTALLSLPKEIDVIQAYELGVDLKLPAGQNHPLGKNRTIVWSVTVASAADYDIYDKHEVHQKIIKEVIKPTITPGSRAAIQYEIWNKYIKKENMILHTQLQLEIRVAG